MPERTPEPVLLERVAEKVREAQRLDLLDVILTLDEVHALLHTNRAKWCNEVGSHEPHTVSALGNTFWCYGGKT